MKDSNTLKLLTVIAGDNYKILSLKDSEVELLHRKCGHRFTTTVTKIAKNNFSCNRCDDVTREKIINTAAEIKSLRLFDLCLNKLPKGYAIYGDTSTEDSIITVSRPTGDNFEIKISDLLNDKNLPDCLLHRNSEMIPSIQLSILDIFMREELEILDDFSSFDDTVRIKDNKREIVYTITVREIVSELEKGFDKNFKQIVRLHE